MNDQADKLRQVIDNLKLRQSGYQIVAPVIPVKRSARVITVTSGKGGVGKTNITINLAIALSGQGLRVVILDADFGLANIDVLFGIIPQYTLVDVIRERKSILEILTDGPNNIKFISGGSGVEDLVKLKQEQVSKFVENMALLDKLADIILIDTGAGLSENIMSFIMASDEVLLVATPEPTSITDAYALIKMVSNRDKTRKIKIIVNKAANPGEADDVLKKLTLVADKFLGINLEPAGYILRDDSVVRSVMKQQPFLIGYPKSQAARNITDISAELIKERSEMGALRNLGFRGFLNKLVGFMKA